jgi:DNA invertase Pin-like site-specific DNA recombinase
VTSFRYRIDATEQPIDTATAVGKCFLDMLGVCAEFKTNLRRERQLGGIASIRESTSLLLGSTGGLAQAKFLLPRAAS